MGHVLTAGLGQNTARQAGMEAGLPAMTINKVCGSGLMARLAGFEPAAPTFGGSYSIQVSYKRMTIF